MFKSVTALAVACVALASPAAAQKLRLAGGWFGGGAGPGFTHVNCRVCATGRDGGLSGYLAGGITVAPGARLGAELTGWFNTDQGVHQRLLMFGPVLNWHPQPSGAWSLKSGLGLLEYHAGTDNPDDDELGATALGVQIGAGYDLRMGTRLWLTPFATLLASTSSNLTTQTTVVVSGSFSMPQIGAGLGWR